MPYAVVKISTGAVIDVGPLPPELIGLAEVSLACIDAAHNPVAGAGVDPCPEQHLDRGYLPGSALTTTQIASLTTAQLGALGLP